MIVAQGAVPVSELVTENQRELGLSHSLNRWCHIDTQYEWKFSLKAENLTKKAG